MGASPQDATSWDHPIRIPRVQLVPELDDAEVAFAAALADRVRPPPIGREQMLKIIQSAEATTPQRPSPGEGESLLGRLQIAEPRRAYESEFERLAVADPRRLSEWMLSGTLKPHELTLAAEACALAQESSAVVPALVELLRDHPRPLVREGAVYGLAGHRDSDDAVAALRRCVQFDPVGDIRETAEEVLNDWG